MSDHECANCLALHQELAEARNDRNLARAQLLRVQEALGEFAACESARQDFQAILTHRLAPFFAAYGELDCFPGKKP